MNLIMELNTWIKKKFGEAITEDSAGNTGIRIINEPTDQFLTTLTTSVGTTAVQIDVPENATEYTIFHQSEDGIVFWGDEDVDNTYPKLNNGEVIEVTGKNDFEIYGITSTGTITVYVVVTSRS